VGFVEFSLNSTGSFPFFVDGYVALGRGYWQWLRQRLEAMTVGNGWRQGQWLWLRQLEWLWQKAVASVVVVWVLLNSV
jgi:hypothetical protein